MTNALETPWVTLEVNDVPLTLCNDLGRPNLRMISWSTYFYHLLSLLSTLVENPMDGSLPGSHPWDSPGKNTGVGCHFLLQCMKVKSESEVTQSCPTLHNLVDCSPPGSSVHGVFHKSTEKAEEVVKQTNKQNCSMKSSWDLVCPGHYKVSMGHHLLLMSPKGSLKHWSLFIISIVPGGLSL